MDEMVSDSAILLQHVIEQQIYEGARSYGVTLQDTTPKLVITRIEHFRASIPSLTPSKAGWRGRRMRLLIGRHTSKIEAGNRTSSVARAARRIVVTPK
jgi:hypothetical protein